MIIFPFLFTQQIMKPNFVYYVEVNRKFLKTSPVLLPLVQFQDSVDRQTASSGNERHYLAVHILLDGLFSSCQFVFLLTDEQNKFYGVQFIFKSGQFFIQPASRFQIQLNIHFTHLCSKVTHMVKKIPEPCEVNA